MSDTFPNKKGSKQGDTLKPLVFNFALEYSIRTVKVNQDGLKLNGAHQFLFCADDVDTVDESIHTIEENTESLLVASKETVLEVNADTTKYMASRD